ncbi:MAG: tetratricopeptide repeat protein [Acinetobacter sp.]
MINRYTKYVVSLGVVITLVGCQTTPQHKTTVTKPVEKPKATHTVPTPDGVKITPYDHPEIKREKVPVVIPQQKAKSQKLDDGQGIPAFKNLMQQTQVSFQKGQWDAAERSALQAQRLAPQSAETFLYLARIANQKKQYANAESLARRGLGFAQSSAQKKMFWNVILQSGQQLKNQQTVAEALRQLKSL